MQTECAKTKYSSKEWAELDIRRINKKSAREKKPVRAYWCKGCSCWHITSKPIIK